MKEIAALSYAHGVSEIPLRGETLADALDAAADRHSERLAVITRRDNGRLSFGELREVAARLARAFVALGVKSGDRVAMWAPNGAEWIVAMYAAAKAGASFVGINPAFRATELEDALATAAPVVLIAARQFANNDCAATLARIGGETSSPDGRAMFFERVPSLRRVVYLGGSERLGGTTWSQLLTDEALVLEPTVEERQAACDPDDTALILFTSGTAGQHKGVMLSHHNVVNGGFFVGVQLRYRRPERVCIPVPLFHVFGLVAGAVGAMVHGATVVLPSESFDARLCLETIEQEACTAVFGVPAMFTAMLEHPQRRQHTLASLRTGVVSGAACAPATLRRIVAELHLPELTIGYGMTEFGPILYTSVDDHVERRATTVGAVQPHIECKIVEPASGRIVRRGTAGELCARGFGLMQGYVGAATPTETPVDRSGWMHTGDLAIMADDGYVTIVGRRKELIIRGGENIAAGEIEQLLASHDKVLDAQVVGVPDALYGEEICAWIRLRSDERVSESELRRFCRTRLALHKVPRYFCFTDEFPRTATGKPLKRALRAIAIEKLALTSVDDLTTADSHVAEPR